MPKKTTGGRNKKSDVTTVRKRSISSATEDRCRFCEGKLNESGACWNCVVFEGDLIADAEAGNVDAARELLRTLRERLDHNAPAGPLLAQWVSNALTKHLDNREPLERALRLLSPRKDRPGGRSEEYDHTALAAVYTLLRDHGMKAEAAMKLIRERLGASRMTMQRVRKDHNEIDGLSTDNLERRQRALVALAELYLPKFADAFGAAAD